jgi:acyl transferase domain-containing protein
MGVFIGITWMEYATLLAELAPTVTAFASTGGALSVAAGRLSYALNPLTPQISKP